MTTTTVPPNYREHKKCSRCQQVLPISDFNKNLRKGVNYGCSKCRKCHAEYQKERHCPRSRRDEHLKYAYGITQADYDEMLHKQDYSCAICDDQDVDLVVDHDHKTGKVRGLLCHHCNTGIGKLQDSVDVLSNAINYLHTYIH